MKCIELAKHQIPVLTAGAPRLLDALGGKIQHPAQGIVIGKAGLVLCDLPELAVELLNDIRRVYDPPDFGRVFIKRAQNISAFFPAPDAGRVLPAPLFPELEQLIQGHSGVDLLQIRGHLLDVLPSDKPCGRAYLVDDAAL